MKSPARLGESAPSTSTPSTGGGVALGAARPPRGAAVMRSTLGHRTDSVRQPVGHRRSASLGHVSADDPQRSEADASLRRRALRARSGSARSRGRDVLVTQLLVPRRRADRGRDGAGRGRRRSPGSAAWKYVAGLAFAVAALPLGAAARGLARADGQALRPPGRLDHPALPRRRDRDRGRGPHPAAGVPDRGGRAADLAAVGGGRLAALAGDARRAARAGGRRPVPAPTCSSASSTSCPGCRSTAAGCSRPASGRSPATPTAAPSSPAGAAGSPPWRCCSGRC